MSMSLKLLPRVSEKAYALSQSRNTYVFDVPGEANKQSVASAVSAQFKVTVETVNINIVKGKVKRTYRKGARPSVGRDNSVKKAYVRLKDGDHIPLFAADETANTKAVKDDAPVEAKSKSAKKTDDAKTTKDTGSKASGAARRFNLGRKGAK